MKKIILIISMVCILNTNILHAQTSPFNGMCILVVEVLDKSTSEQINGLEIYVADKSGEIVFGDWPDYFSSYDTSSLYFKPNPAEINPKWATCYDPFMQIRYCFAKENYIRVIECIDTEERLYIHVNDTSSTRKNKYQPIVIKLNPENFYELSENVGIWYNLDEEKETSKPDFPFNHEIKVYLTTNMKLKKN